MKVFPIDWSGQDVVFNQEGACRYEIHCWGKTDENISVLLRIPFTPYFFVRPSSPEAWSTAQQRFFILDAVTKLRALFRYSTPVRRVPLLGFTNNAQVEFVQVAFETHEDFKKAKYKLGRDKSKKTYDGSLDPLLRFFHVQNIQPASWIEVDERSFDATADCFVAGAGTREFVVPFKEVKMAQATDQLLPPLVIASWDLECVSETGMFPMSSKPRDHIITIGTAFQRYGDESPYLRSAITLGTCDRIDGVDVVSCEKEEDVINTWLHLLAEQKTDVMVGYNVLGFDYKYLDGRREVLVDDDTGEPKVSLHLLGKAVEGGGVPTEKNLSSAAYGDNKYFFLKSPGVMILDLLQVFRKELKLDNYSLNNVCKKYLKDGDEKIDLKPGELFRKFTMGSAERAEIAKYCVRDVELPLKLMEKLSTLENALQMANAVCCPLDYIHYRGQQIRVYSQLLRKARAMGFVAPDVVLERTRTSEDPAPEKYEGATVLEAKKGSYFHPISALDFASLYPSIIRAWNMCPSTLVIDPRYADLDGVEYYEVDTGAGTVRFAQGVRSVVPELLRELAQFRKEAKKDMAEASKNGDEFMASVYNGKQIAYKVCANSIYGFFGATRGMLPVVQMAAAVTATGRAMIERTKSLAESLVPGSTVIYGDSVAEYTPTIVQTPQDGVRIISFQNLALEVQWTQAIDGKEVAECPDGWSVWTETGWSPLARLIRHYYGPEGSCTLVRVSTSTGCVDVTKDHSLLEENCVPLMPKDVVVGKTILASVEYPIFPLVVLSTPGIFSISGPEAMVLARVFDDKSTRFATFEEAERYLTLCNKAYPGAQHFIYPTTQDDGGYMLHPGSGVIRNVPPCILSASLAVRHIFWTAASPPPRTARSHEELATYAVLVESLGYTYEIHADERNVYLNVTDGDPKNQNDGGRVQGMVEVPFAGGYVYDATTSNHHFAAGVGKLVVHNTDSVLVKFAVENARDQDDLSAHFAIAQRVADDISRTFPPPIELEFEKIYFPYLLFSKKRYAGLMFTRPTEADKIDVKGIQLVRRDNAPIVKDVSNDILNAIMYERSASLAVDVARQAVLRVLRQEEPLEKFIISKALRGNYKNPDSLPHVTVARKLRERQGHPPAMGERVRYVFIDDSENCIGLQASRAEDPGYVAEHGIPLDVLYYVENQLVSPITTLLDVLVDDAHDAVLGYETIATLLERLRQKRQHDMKVAKRIKTNVSQNQREITTFFQHA
jgi:DNA polymerase elongation subunit (family B)